MIEKDFFDEFYKKLLSETGNENYIAKLKTLIENKKLTRTQYQKLIKENSKGA